MVMMGDGDGVMVLLGDGQVKKGRREAGWGLTRALSTGKAHKQERLTNQRKWGGSGGVSVPGGKRRGGGVQVRPAL